MSEQNNPVAWQATGENGLPIWDESSFSDVKGNFDYERPLYAAPAEPVYDQSVVKRIATQMGWTPPSASPAAQTDGYVQTVPDKCDRIVWRNRYWHLSEDGIAAQPAAPASEYRPSQQWYASKIQETLNEDFAIGHAAPSPAPAAQADDWPMPYVDGPKQFEVMKSDPSNSHSPWLLRMPGTSACLLFNHEPDDAIDEARCKWIAAACNAVRQQSAALAEPARVDRQGVALSDKDMREAFEEALPFIGGTIHVFSPTRTARDERYLEGITEVCWRTWQAAYSRTSSSQRVALSEEVWGVRIGDSDRWAYTNSESDADFWGKQSGLKYEKRRYVRASSSRAEVEIPEGWKLVPVKPTIAMCIRGADGADNSINGHAAAQVYAFMLAAAEAPKEGD